MAEKQSTKRLQIDKANTAMVVTLAIACFMVVFSIVAGKALLSQRSYQAKVIEKKEKARDQLVKNIDASGTLINAYKTFTGTAQNIIDGNSTGNGPKDGDNAKIIIDALPSSYDFPGLTNSLEKLLNDNNVKITSINGTDDEVSQQSNQSAAKPVAVPMPFQINVSGSYSAIKNLVSVFERSIRPIQANVIKISGSDKSLIFDMTGQTYYQPAKALKNTTEVVK